MWLISYPRSGNTFFRVILHDVYGIDSGAFSKRQGFEQPDWVQTPVIKTHVLPFQISQDILPGHPVIYLVRDGRDAVVSSARRQSSMVRPGSDYYENLEHVIHAPGDSHFGGWSRHVKEWLPRASVVIKFEDLIVKPIECVERIREFFPLPEPDVDKLPTFEDLRSNSLPFRHNDSNQPEESKRKWRENFFRRGKVGSWKDEMPPHLEKLFWRIHGRTMKEMGYPREIPMAAQCVDFLVNSWIDGKTGLKDFLRPYYRRICGKSVAANGSPEEKGEE